MEIILKPTNKQHQAYEVLKDKDTSYLVFGGGAGGGKSWLGCEWLLVNCILYPGTKWYIGRNELKRLMASTYVTWQKVCSFHKVPQDSWKLNGQYNYIEFSNGSRIDLLDVKYQPSDPLYERFGSLEYTGGWLEEAGEIHFLAFDVLKSRMGRQMNKEYNLPVKMLITCNPKKNWLYRDVYKLHKDGILPKKFAFIQSLYGDNPHTASDYAKQLEEIRDEVTKQRLMFGSWEYDDEPGALMTYDKITDLFSNTVVEGDKWFITGDIARYGRDKTVLMVWKGLECVKIYTYSEQSLLITQQRIQEIAKEYKIPFSQILVDEDGVGGGVVDNLRIKGFLNNSTPLLNKLSGKPEHFQNLKTQCYFMLADYVNSHKIAVNCKDVNIQDTLTEELEQVKRKDIDSDNKLKLVGKDEIREQIGRSPDYSDALMMRMWFEILQPTKDEFETPLVRILNKDSRDGDNSGITDYN